MNCPACLSIMYNEDEIHKISATKKRMNLHCWNFDCPSRNIISDSNKLYYTPFMQVIVDDPNPWECINYGLIIMKNNKPILIEGNYKYNFTISKIVNGMTMPNIFDKIILWEDLAKTKFVRLSTNNDMHIQAINLAEKMTKLLPFI